MFVHGFAICTKKPVVKTNFKKYALLSLDIADIMKRKGHSRSLCLDSSPFHVARLL